MRIYFLISFFILFSFNSFAIKVTKIGQIKNHESEITAIDFSNQGLSVFPIEILNCKNLISLNLSNNGIINIPLALGKLETLKELNLSGNQGVSFLDLDVLFDSTTFKLKVLDLSDCELGFVPDLIGVQRSLINLNLSGNKLRSLPYQLIRLSKMQTLNLSNNRLEDISWQVHQWWALKNLDVSKNPTLEADALLVSLSYFDGLDKLVIGYVKSFPRDFQHLNVKDLVIEDSFVGQFPRRENSSKINRLTFTNCKFKNAANLVETVNKYVSPYYISLQKMPYLDLLSFLQADVDSVDIRNNHIKDISALATMKKLVWCDARGNPISPISVQKVKAKLPNLNLLLQEPVKPNTGIAPPIAKFIKKPESTTVKANKPAMIQLGKSIFEIPKGAFLKENGEVFEGEVKLDYTEYFTPTDIFLSGITMTSDSADENLIFSSGGMFNLTASDDKGNELFMNPTKPVQVDLYSSNANPDMNVYFLNDQGVWEYKGKDEIVEPFKIDRAKLDSAVNTQLLNYKYKDVIIVKNRFVPITRNNGYLRTFEIRFDEYDTRFGNKKVYEGGRKINVDGRSQVASFIGESTFLYDGDIDSLAYYHDYLKAVRKRSNKTYKRLKQKKGIGKVKFTWGMSFITELNLTVNNEKDQLMLNFMDRDSAVSIPVSIKSNPANPKGRLKTFEQYFKTLNNYAKKYKINDSKIKRELDIIQQKEKIKVYELLRESEAKRQEFISENKDFFKSQAGKGSIIRSFELSSFGIWNCDVRQRMLYPIPIPTHFVGETDEEILENPEKIIIIDFESNGVVSFSHPKDAFFDKDAKTAIVIFFSAVSVGIYQSWKKMINREKKNEELPLRMLNLNKISVQEFQAIIEN